MHRKAPLDMHPAYPQQVTGKCWARNPASGEGVRIPIALDRLPTGFERCSMGSRRFFEGLAMVQVFERLSTLLEWVGMVLERLSKIF